MPGSLSECQFTKARVRPWAFVCFWGVVTVLVRSPGQNLCTGRPPLHRKIRLERHLPLPEVSRGCGEPSVDIQVALPQRTGPTNAGLGAKAPQPSHIARDLRIGNQTVKKNLDQTVSVEVVVDSPFTPQRRVSFLKVHALLSRLRFDREVASQLF